MTDTVETTSTGQNGADTRSVSGDRLTVTLSGIPDAFLGTLDPSRREVELEYALRLTVEDFEALHRSAEHGVGGGPMPAYTDDLVHGAEDLDGDELIIAGQEVMQAWERPLMQRMAEVAARSHGDVLEVGFGMGISAEAIVAEGVRSYTVIDCNADVLARARDWAARRPEQRITVVDGRWQDRIGELGEFDGIFFDTYPTTAQEYQTHINEDAQYVQHFLPAAAAHLRPGGVLTYFTLEIDSLSRPHQRMVLELFSGIELSIVDGLVPPSDCSYWWARSMAVVAAVR